MGTLRMQGYDITTWKMRVGVSVADVLKCQMYLYYLRTW